MIMRVLGILLLLTSFALGQTIQQSGQVTPGHAPVWVTTGILGDGGTAANPGLTPITSLGVQNNGGPGICLSSAPVTGPYNQLCMAVSTAGAAQLSLQNFGGAPAESLNVVVNGLSYSIPGSLSTLTLGGTAINGGSLGDCLTVGTSSLLSQATCATVAGSNTQIQFNSSNLLGASANLTWVSPTLTIGAAGSTTGQLAIAGGTSGSTVLTSLAAASGTLTLPSATDTLTGKATTDVLTNKTYDTAGAGNVFKINGTPVTSVTGSGAAVLANTPTLITPVLGAATATSINGLTLTSSTGTLTLTNGKTLAASNTIALAAGADGQTFTFPSASDTVATIAAAQILTNKTLTSPTINTPVINNASTLSAGTNGTAGGTLVLNGSSTGSVTLSVNAGAGTTTFRLPNTNGSNGQLLQTDGSGDTSWVSASGTGTVTSVTAGAGLATGTAAALTTAGTIYGISAPQGRLTLVSGTPVMTANETAKGTIYYDCYRSGNVVPYYNGTDNVSEVISNCEVSDLMVAAASAGQVVSGQVYDVWWVHSGTNRICIAMSASTGGVGGWSSDSGGSNTARGTGYSQLDQSGTVTPYISNKNSITNCFNNSTNYGPVSANQGTYLGTIYATANGQTGMNYSATASGGGGNILGVYNAYNRVPVSAFSADSTTTWSYNSATWRKANNNVNNSITWVDGLQQSSVTGIYAVAEFSGGTAFAYSGCQADFSSGAPALVGVNPSATVFFVTTQCQSFPLLGLHVLNAIEAASTGSSVSFDGTSLAGNPQTQGLSIRLDM
jgi:hypothetical protein